MVLVPVRNLGPSLDSSHVIQTSTRSTRIGGTPSLALVSLEISTGSSMDFISAGLVVTCHSREAGSSVYASGYSQGAILPGYVHNPSVERYVNIFTFSQDFHIHSLPGSRCCPQGSRLRDTQLRRFSSYRPSCVFIVLPTGHMFRIKIQLVRHGWNN